MSQPEDRSLSAEVLGGRNQRLRNLAALGILPLPQEELIELQVELATSDEGEIAEQARQSLEVVSLEFLLPFLRETASEKAVAYFAEFSKRRAVVEAAIQRRSLDPEILERIAPKVSPEIQELVLLRQDLIVRSPAILDRLEENPKLSNYARRLITEYRDHLLGGRAKASAEAAAQAEEDAEREVDDEELETEIAKAAAEVEPEGEHDEQTGLSESQVRSLPVAVRMRLSRGAGRTLRSILIRDPSNAVALSALVNSPFTEGEIEVIANSRRISEEILTSIAENREWSRRYRIVHNLVRNPRTPAGTAIRFLPRLSVRDLRQLRFDRNVSEAVRKQAGRLFLARQK